MPEYVNPLDLPNKLTRPVEEILRVKFGDKVKEVSVFILRGEMSALQDIAIESMVRAMIKEGFDGCEVKEGEKKLRFLVCTKGV